MYCRKLVNNYIHTHIHIIKTANNCVIGISECLHSINYEFTKMKISEVARILGVYGSGGPIDLISQIRFWLDLGLSFQSQTELVSSGLDFSKSNFGPIWSRNIYNYD